MSYDQLVELEWSHCPHQVQYRDNLFGVGVAQEGGLHVLD